MAHQMAIPPAWKHGNSKLLLGIVRHCCRKFVCVEHKVGGAVEVVHQYSIAPHISRVPHRIQRNCQYCKPDLVGTKWEKTTQQERMPVQNTTVSNSVC